MDYATFQSTYANAGGTFSDNTTRQITESDLRQFASDILGSFALSASSTSNSQTFEIGDFNMSNAGAQKTKTIYCGPSSNALNAKFFTCEVISDSDASIPKAKWMAPYFVTGDKEPILKTGTLFSNGASSVCTIAASGFMTNSTDFDTTTNYNRGYVTLFF